MLQSTALTRKPAVLHHLERRYWQRRILEEVGLAEGKKLGSNLLHTAVGDTSCLLPKGRGHANKGNALIDVADLNLKIHHSSPALAHLAGKPGDVVYAFQRAVL